MKNLKILFFGTPDIAVPYLEWLANHHTVVGVVCKADEPVGRGYKLTPPPVKVAAQKRNLPLFQPEGKWTEDILSQLKNLGADVGVAVAYGRLMPRGVFEAARLGTINVHFSLLPKYRGAGPMQWSLIKGDKETGVTLFWIEEGMDSGPLFHQLKIQVEPNETAKTLEPKLIELGIKSLTHVCQEIMKGNIIKQPQQGKPTLAPMLKKVDGNIDWEKSARDIKNLIAGVYQWPGATTTFSTQEGGTKKLKVYAVQILDENKQGKAGQIIEFQKNNGFVVQTGKGQLLVKEVQPEGKKTMPAPAFWNGVHLKVGDTLR